MAQIKDKNPNCIEDNFFVDNTCIDCGTCYWIAPSVFRRHDGASIVYAPTESPSKRESAYHALYSCPTHSIGVQTRDPQGKTVLESFPISIEGEVYHCGFHARSSFGAASYYVKTSEGNILVDSPRYTSRLADTLESMGGIQWHLLTHKDDIADTDRYWERFGGSRVIHQLDTDTHTQSYEVILQGEQTQPFNSLADIEVIPVPGHTRGSVCYLYRQKYLFTGDHLAFSRELGHLYAFKRACWYDFEVQIESMKKLLDYSFEWVLPGHSAPMHGTPEQIKDSLKQCIQWMQAQAKS
jgi:glyoxylase-like metal-dependent hydrolase (beta-lactamase superfamily II)/ferredoxin